jgi:hypothetical protein
LGQLGALQTMKRTSFSPETRRRSTQFEIEFRREEVLRLRLAHLSEPEIAERLCVSAATVSRDLRNIHENWGERFRAEFDPLREINEAVAVYSVLEAAALRELVRLESEPSKSTTAAKMKTIHAAGAMRARRVEVLVAAGLMNTTDLRSQSTLPRAADIRAAIEDADREPAWCPGDGGASVSRPAELAGCG